MTEEDDVCEKTHIIIFEYSFDINNLSGYIFVDNNKGSNTRGTITDGICTLELPGTNIVAEFNFLQNTIKSRNNAFEVLRDGTLLSNGQ